MACKSCQGCSYPCEKKQREFWDDYNAGLQGFSSFAARYLDGISTINEFIATRGDNAMVAALIEGSIGYFTVKHAENDLAAWKRGEMQSYCERAMACFRCDRIDMYLHDIRYFESCSAEKQAKLIEFVNATRGMDSISQMSISMHYPTMLF